MSSDKHSQGTKVLLLYGTRPEAIKMAPVIQALRARTGEVDLLVCSSGQHREMLHQVEEALGLVPDLVLDVMRPGQSLNQLCGRLFETLTPVLEAERPDWVLVQGDTTTAMVGAIAGFHAGARIGHIEAGLRSGDLGHPFPEEGNRRLIDQVTSAFFAPTARARQRLLDEGVDESRVHLVGNTVVDALLSVAALGDDGPSTVEGNQVLITLHRRESHGRTLNGLLSGVADLSRAFPNVKFVFPVHKNPEVETPAREILADLPNVVLSDPIGYREMVQLLRRAVLVITDSGGLQEEAPTFGAPVLVLRQTTERPEGVEAGVARLIGLEPSRLLAEASKILESAATVRPAAPDGGLADSPYGDGLSARRIAAILLGEPWQPFAAKPTRGLFGTVE